MHTWKYQIKFIESFGGCTFSEVHRDKMPRISYRIFMYSYVFPCALLRARVVWCEYPVCLPSCNCILLWPSDIVIGDMDDARKPFQSETYKDKHIYLLYIYIKFIYERKSIILLRFKYEMWLCQSETIASAEILTAFFQHTVAAHLLWLRLEFLPPGECESAEPTLALVELHGFSNIIIIYNNNNNNNT